MKKHFDFIYCHKFIKNLNRMSDPRLRQIKIKTGVLKRLTKEKTVYEKEIDQQKARIERFRGEGKDEHVLKKEEEILQEALMMVPDSHRR